LINWSAFSFSIMLLQLDIHCMWIWHWFWRKLVKFCCMSSNNFTSTLLFAFSLCKVIWLFMYTQISLFLNAFSLHIAIALLIACSFAFVMIILPETLVALLHLTSLCVNITVVSISVSTSAIFFEFAMRRYTSLCSSPFWWFFLILYSVYWSYRKFRLLQIRFEVLLNAQFLVLMISWSEKFQFLLLNSVFFALCSIFNISAWVCLCTSWLFKINSTLSRFSSDISINNEIYLYKMLTTNLLQAMLVRRAEQSHQHQQSSNSALLTCWAHTQSKSETITTQLSTRWSLHIHRRTATSLHTWCNSYMTYTYILRRHDSAFAHIQTDVMQ